ncbi:MAG TPA: glycosyltransferase [Terracidiphilus sp.]|jgi:glycosyltransferase involved in cell wall biosynthesis|nr:glycosyltransferase [Terracidiphilus sp.]
MNHIALLIPGLDRIGGAERQMMLLAKGLRGRGWRVSVVALSGAGGEAAAELTAAGVTFLSLHMRKGLADPRGWMRFNRWLRRERPDVVQAHLPHAAWLARWSRVAAPMRVLVDTLHSSSTGTLGRRFGYRFSNWLPDRVTAVSAAVAQAHLQARMVTAARLAVLPNGVDLETWKPDAEVRNAFRRVLGLQGKFLWFAAGRLDPVKDYGMLLQAMVDVPEAANLVIAGSGPMENELHRLSDELGLEDRVQFLGFEPNVLRWMRVANGFVLASRWEGLPMVVLEAAACGVPAVATDVPGTHEVVVDGKTGLLAAQGSAKALAAAMTRMMEMPGEERRAMGERARQFVQEHYSLDAALDRWEALYAELLERNPMRRRWGR